MSSDPVHTREPTIPILHSAVGQEILSTKSRSEDDPKETPRPPNSALSLSIPRTCIVPHTKCRRQTRPSLYAVERCHGLFRPYYRSLCSTTAFSRKIDQMALSCPNRCIGPLLGNSRCHPRVDGVRGNSGKSILPTAVEEWIYSQPSSGGGTSPQDTYPFQESCFSSSVSSFTACIVQ